ncbi:glutathione S-transferase family protein [Escherichia coli]|nr:glutathione S-transferase family protein [Escherichia coli]NUD60631.1 glutathione S-transferase family protein [Escherichia coli]NUE34623.1 glutathione S-transferase family protein [Escherichia coli]NUE47778.1 glutathione S-transferase family protein [Escherichia coli]
MLTIHHLGISQSDRIVWLCEELHIPYQLVKYEREPVTGLAPSNYKALHPYGTAPVITDGNITLGESGAIVQYILARYGDNRLAPDATSPEFAEYLYWFHFANASLMASSMVEMAFNGHPESKNYPVLNIFKERTARAFNMIEERLHASPYFAGQEFSAADIMMFFPLTTMRTFVDRDISIYPNLINYLKRISERSAWKKSKKIADPEFNIKLT